jgi:plastocyanin
VETTRKNHGTGISITAFLVAVVVSLAYYQFVYVPEVNTKPYFPDAILHPKESVQVKIVEGAAIKSNPQNFVPKVVRGIIGMSNRIVWTNMDSTTSHTVTSDNGYVDVISGKFDSTNQLSSLISPGKTFAFTFTKVGEYAYHCEPHPHMQGKVEIVENFS